jgi:hypothetical protein
MQAGALPRFYDERHNGCNIPTQGYKNHQAPVPNAAITFALANSTGADVTSWKPGGNYTVSIAAYAEPINIWFYTSGGAPPGNVQVLCKMQLDILHLSLANHAPTAHHISRPPLNNIAV